MHGSIHIASAERRTGLTGPLMLVLAGVLSATACETSTGPTVTLPAGFLEVEYSGSIEGMLSVTGDLRLDEGRLERRSFAAAGANRFTPDEKLTVVAFQPTGTSEGTYLAITVPDLPSGTSVPIDVNCFELECSSMLLFFGVGQNRPHETVDPDVDRACWIETGTLLITSRAQDRVGGTFSGSGGCVFDNRTDPVTAFEVVEASFDVPVSFLYQPRVDVR